MDTYSLQNCGQLDLNYSGAGLFDDITRSVSGNVNEKVHEMGHNVVHGLADKAEERLRAESSKYIDKLPEFTQDAARSLADKGIHELVKKGQSIADDEVNKYNLL